MFEDTASRFEKDAKLKEYAAQINEIWLFFDVEDQDHDKWDTRWQTISKLQNVRGGRKKLPVRLLMTSGCLEYWFLLHYSDYRSMFPITKKEKRKHHADCAELPSGNPTWRGNYKSTAGSGNSRIRKHRCSKPLAFETQHGDHLYHST